MFSNRHVVVALLVAPLLSLGAWFAVDQLVGDPPQQAEAGRDYPLLANSNCRYNSGLCTLANGDLELEIDARALASGWQLRLRASHPLDGAIMAIDGGAPQPLQNSNGALQQWDLTLPMLPADGARLQLVAATGGSRYYADTGSDFLQRYRSPRP